MLQPYEIVMNGPKRSYSVTKSSVGRCNGKLKDILSSSRHKSEGKITEADLINIPIIKQTDNARLLPKYTTSKHVNILSFVNYLVYREPHKFYQIVKHPFSNMLKDFLESNAV